MGKEKTLSLQPNNKESDMKLPEKFKEEVKADKIRTLESFISNILKVNGIGVGYVVPTSFYVKNALSLILGAVYDIDTDVDAAIRKNEKYSWDNETFAVTLTSKEDNQECLMLVYKFSAPIAVSCKENEEEWIQSHPKLAQYHTIPKAHRIEEINIVY